MSLATRREALDLYRRLLRLSRSWISAQPEETPTERAYIAEETKRIFRANKHVQSAQQIHEHLREAEARMTMAEHYRYMSIRSAV